MVSTGNTETATHNAVGKIYVTLNKDPVTFLTNNQFYDPKVRGGGAVVGRLTGRCFFDPHN